MDFFGTISVKSYTCAEKDLSIMNIVYNFQMYINNTFLKYLSKDFSGILSGMIIGETSNISNEIKDDFQKTGITHLLAVSGSNVATVILFSNYLVVMLFGKKFSDYISIIFILFFILISGASPSVVRAGIMAILNLLANILIRKTDSIGNLILASFFILIYNPITLVNIGFLLSFAGTIGIIVFSEYIKSFFDKYIKFNILSEIIALNLSAQITILPIMLYFFNSFSLVGILANLLIVPIIGFLTFLGISLLFSSLISSFFSRFLSTIIIVITNYIIFVVDFLSKLDFLNLILPTPNICLIIFYYVFVYLEFLRNKMKKQNYLMQISYKKNYFLKLLKSFYCLIGILFIICLIFQFISRDYTELTAIDVGQGDSFLIVTEKGKRILIDGGGSETSNYDVGKNILMPYLLDRGFMKIDYIFVSHSHADHIDGIFTVLENFRVNDIFVGPSLKNDEKIEKLYELANKNKISIIRVSEGTKIKIDDLEIEILYPAKEIEEENINNLSVIMKVVCNGRKILFMGDAEKEVEEYLIDKYGDLLNADILKVGHHGAKTSSMDDFIQKVSPDISLISVAKDNLYGHPNEDVIKRLNLYGNILKTSELGEINLRIYNDGKIKLYD